jgi:L-methionine (R)-S-oxide reductase
MFQSEINDSLNPLDYSSLELQLMALLASQREFITNAAQTTSFIYQMLPEINWCGFYLLKQQKLILGPFQGKVACTPIPLGKGVCGTAAQTQQIQLIDDVTCETNHIVCDSASRSELVLPVIVNGELKAVLDIDSPRTHRFTEDDAKGINRLVNLFIESTEFESLSAL